MNIGLHLCDLSAIGKHGDGSVVSTPFERHTVCICKDAVHEDVEPMRQVLPSCFDARRCFLLQPRCHRFHVARGARHAFAIAHNGQSGLGERREFRRDKELRTVTETGTGLTGLRLSLERLTCSHPPCQPQRQMPR